MGGCDHPYFAAGGAWTYRLGADALSPRTGLFAAGILATSAIFGVPEDTYSVTLQLLNAARESVAQADTGLDSWRYLCLRSEIDIRDVPAGDYGLWAAVYDWRTGARLPGTDLTNGGVSDLLHVGDVAIGE